MRGLSHYWSVPVVYEVLKDGLSQMKSIPQRALNYSAYHIDLFM